MKQTDWYKDLDFWGFAASLLCAVHCAALPLLITFSVAGNFALWTDPRLEFAFLSLSALIALLSLRPGKRIHHSWVPILMAGLGFVAIVVSHAPEFMHIGHTHDTPSSSSWVAAAGGLLVAGAHWQNWRLLRPYRGCSID